MRILHIAPFNTAGVPIAFVHAERALGHESRLITFGRNPFGFEEDVCLDLPWLNGSFFLSIRNRFSSSSRRARRSLEATEESAQPRPLIWKPESRFEAGLITIREKLWLPRIRNMMKTLDFFSFDLYQLDGGLDFFRDGRLAQEIKARGKKIVCCYLGSDLRARGVMPAVDAVSDLNFTVEFDHLRLHPDIHYLFFPFDPWRFQPASRQNERLRIFHSATNRKYKGTDLILEVGKRLEREEKVELVFMENTPHDKLLATKAQCDIVVDQITNLGGVGYGVSSLEALSMGIPVCTRLTPEYEAFIPDHPFVHVTPDTLYDRLVELIRNAPRRREIGQRSRLWVEKRHDARQVVNSMRAMYRERGWLD
jgi:hypothetical protein